MDPSRNQQTGQSATDAEAKMREQAILDAMMDDLGMARLDQLPLDEGDHGHGRGHRGRGAGGDSRRHQPTPAAPRARPAPNVPGLTDLWKDAIASGAFNDEDAEAVRGLDDLGGGRIYDTGMGDNNQMHRVFNKTVKILEHQNSKRSRRHFAESAAPNKRTRTNAHTYNNAGSSDAGPSNAGHGNSGRRNTTGNRQSSSEAQTTTSRASATSSSRSKGKSTRLNPMARPARAGWALPRENLTPPELQIPEPGVNAPLPLDLGNVVSRTGARFASADINPALPGLVVLSAAGPPTLGFFTVLLGHSFHCQWPISAWDDYLTGAGGLLQVSFKDGSNTVQWYDIYFVKENELREFVSTLRSLRAGSHAAQTESESESCPAPVPAASVTVLETPAVAATAGAMRHKTTSSESEASRDVLSTQPVRGISDPVTAENRTTSAFIDNGVSGSAAGNVGLSGKSVTEQPEETALLRADQSEHDSLINFEANDDSSVISQPRSDATQLLSTLEPYESNDGAGNELDQTLLSVSALTFMARTFFNFFLMSGAGGSTKTAGELDQTAEGVRSALLSYMLKEAREQGLDDDRVQEFRTAAENVFEAEMNRLAARRASAHTRRIQYSASQLLSLRQAAVEPPSSLADIPYLPRRGDARRDSGSQSSHAFNYQSATSDAGGAQPRATFTQSQVTKSMNAMQWVLGNTVAPETKVEERKPEPVRTHGSAAKSATGSNVARSTATQDTGLGSSRWATGAPEIKHANFFTGPRYEKTWSKRSYLQDLTELDPQTKVEAAAEDLMNFYFPIPSNDEARAGPSKTQTPASHGTRVSTVAGVESGTLTPSKTDKIENLRVGMARLTIHSPTSASPPFSQGGSSTYMPAQVIQSLRKVTSAPSQSAAAPVAQATHRPSQLQPPFAPKSPASALTPVCPQPAQPPSTATAQSAAQPAQPKLRGLAASRHSAGTGPSSSGNFNFHLPRSARG